MTEPIQVVAGVVVRNGRILCVQKGQTKYEYTSYKFEFPGGKVHSNETAEDALRRELKEELDLNVEILQDLGTFTHDYPDLSVSLHVFLCKDDANEPILKEHISLKWLFSNELQSLDWAAADLPVVRVLQRMTFEK